MLPTKPFPNFKWRWLSVQPSEGLLDAPVFWGVLRALLDHEGEAFSSDSLHNSLQEVQEQTKSTVKLARSTERNLLRNSGQYWRGTGLLLDHRGEIRLTELGKKVAEGRITPDEFIALMIRNTVLPNPMTYDLAQQQEWERANIRIKPFELILGVMTELGLKHGIDSSFLTANELIRVVIPLSGVSASIDQIAKHVHRYRHGYVSFDNWPDCTPEANDKRLAREFLLFLSNFGVCDTEIAQGDRYNQKFHFDTIRNRFSVDLEGETFLENPDLVHSEVDRVSYSEIPRIIERVRANAAILKRSGQQAFRRSVFESCSKKCVITNEQTQDVLDAAHIIPVHNGGIDTAENGLCLRTDIHRLYDNGKIRIQPDGHLILHDNVSSSVSYRSLPQRIKIPPTVNSQNLYWRIRYS